MLNFPHMPPHGRRGMAIGAAITCNIVVTFLVVGMVALSTLPDSTPLLELLNWHLPTVLLVNLVIQVLESATRRPDKRWRFFADLITSIVMLFLGAAFLLLKFRGDSIVAEVSAQGVWSVVVYLEFAAADLLTGIIIPIMNATAWQIRQEVERGHGAG
jgi:hypothetical protein